MEADLGLLGLFHEVDTPNLSTPRRKVHDKPPGLTGGLSKARAASRREPHHHESHRRGQSLILAAEPKSGSAGTLRNLGCEEMTNDNFQTNQ
jgi:hypothetical protein